MALPLGEEGPRNYSITPKDHSGVVVIVSLLLMTWSILCFLIRIYTRYTTKIALGADDLLCLIGTLFVILETILANVSVHFGFGKTADLIHPASHILTIERYQFAVTLLSLIVIIVSKCTMICFHFRITPNRNHRLGAWTLLGVSCALGVVWLCVVGARCAGNKPWDIIGGHCSNYQATWIAVATTDILTELAIFALPIWIIRDLQMSLKTKLIVLAAFALRLPVIIPLLAHLLYTTTFPTLGPFMKSLNTRWGTLNPSETAAASFAMDSLRSKEATTRSLGGNTGYAFRVKSEQGKAEMGRRDGSSDDDGGSERMIIRHTTETTVRYDQEQL